MTKLYLYGGLTILALVLIVSGIVYWRHTIKEDVTQEVIVESVKVQKKVQKVKNEVRNKPVTSTDVTNSLHNGTW